MAKCQDCPCENQLRVESPSNPLCAAFPHPLRCGLPPLVPFWFHCSALVSCTAFTLLQKPAANPGVLGQGLSPQHYIFNYYNTKSLSFLMFPPLIWFSLLFKRIGCFYIGHFT